MKSKAPLVMMEQIIMVLIFALAAALCLQTFVLSGKISKRTEAESGALAEAQNAAETIKAGGLPAFMKAYGAVQKEEKLLVLFDGDWKVVPEEQQAEYRMEISLTETGTVYFWQAEIRIFYRDGEELLMLPVAGQTEVMRNE